MTREEIENIPKNVNTLLDSSVTMRTRQKLDEKLNRVCELAIKVLEQEPKMGHWIRCDKDKYGYYTFYCSACNQRIQTKNKDFYEKYCNECGAKMESEE